MDERPNAMVCAAYQISHQVSHHGPGVKHLNVLLIDKTRELYCITQDNEQVIDDCKGIQKTPLTDFEACRKKVRAGIIADLIALFLRNLAQRLFWRREQINFELVVRQPMKQINNR